MKKYCFLLSLILMVFLQNMGCGSSPVTPDELQGVWGGRGLRIEIASGGSMLQYDCGTGEIDEVIQPDRRGNFSAEGWFSPTAGPEPIEGFPRRPAWHIGKITGSVMTLTVIRQDTGALIGVFNLQFGNPGAMIFCR
jgi:hypothetical protein